MRETDRQFDKQKNIRCKEGEIEFHQRAFFWENNLKCKKWGQCHFLKVRGTNISFNTFGIHLSENKNGIREFES